jgi:RHS repeat-associated protein
MSKYFWLFLWLQLSALGSVLAQRGRGGGTTTTPVIEDTAFIPITLYSYPQKASALFKRELVPLRPTIDTAQVSIRSAPTEVSIVTGYVDYFGRPLQQVVRQSSPQLKDVVTPVYYDYAGRTSKQYLPYVDSTNKSYPGSFKEQVLAKDSIFYKSIFPNEDYIYAKTEYERSPLGRILKTYLPGNNWNGAGRGKTLSQRANTLLDSVLIWTIGINTEDDLPTVYGRWPAGSLLVDEVTDEQGGRVLQFKDSEGRTIMTKTAVSATPGKGHVGWLCTYYVYDEMNHLRMVLPPKAVVSLSGVGWNFAANPAIRSGLCYAYWCDDRGRVTMKEIPGKGKAYFAYDLLDRLVMTQDANLRQTGQWTFVKYDGQNRPVKSGLITLSLTKDQIISAAATSADYPALTGTFTITSEAYYDDYAWASGTPLNGNLETANINSTNFISTANAAPEYAQAIAVSQRTRGSLTGSKTLILGTTQYLYSLTLYDDKGRAVQQKQTNYSGGTDVATVQYSFSGLTLRSHVQHQKGGVNAQTHTLLTKKEYDHAGRVKKVIKNLDGGGDKTITDNSFNELGQLQSRVLGNAVETQAFHYNLQGWLTGINKDYVNGGSSGNSRYFGEALFYDSIALNPQYNGSIASVRWKAGGDGIARAYHFEYDRVNRLTAAAFSQQNEGSTAWTSDKVDFSVSGLQYDAGGNILSMTQRGIALGKPLTIDSLQYQYFAHSNRLQNVADLISHTNPLGDFKDTTTASDDYSYDVNGNIVKDWNKQMRTTGGGNGAVYNLLDKPDSIVIAGKNTVHYTYDAAGRKLAKRVNDYTTGTLITRTYLYIGGFVYLNDTLSYALHEEGRVRWAQKRNFQTGAQYYAFEWDYFLRDHQGNVRTVLTEGRDTLAYPAATMEDATIATENMVYARLEETKLHSDEWHPSYPGDNSMGASHWVAKVLANERKIGPNVTLKVMAGDKVSIKVSSWYSQGNTSPNNTATGLIPDLLQSLGIGIGTVSGGHFEGRAEDITNSSTSLSNTATDFITQQNANSSSTIPQAFLNWILLDEQMQFVASSSGFEQVRGNEEFYQHVKTNLPITKNGYLFVYVSNASETVPVYFDNLQVTHTTGPLLQEQSYYPFGLQMHGISSKAALKLNVSYKYNGGVDLEEETGLYNTFYRQYDTQIGRFSGADSRAEEQYGFSTYHFGYNNPISYNDPQGDLASYVDHNGNKWHSPGIFAGTSLAWGEYNWASNSVSYEWGAGPNGMGGTFGYDMLFGSGGGGGAGDVTPGIVQGFFEFAWAGSGRYNIQANYSRGVQAGQGFQVSWSGGGDNNSATVGAMFVSYDRMDQYIREGGGEDGGYSTAAIPIALTATAADGPIPIGDAIGALILAGAVAYDATQRVYVTYTLTNPLTHQIYAGRTSGYGNPYSIMMNRYYSHHMRSLGFGSPSKDMAAQGASAYFAIRGREQQLIDYYGGVGYPRVANPIRAVARGNLEGLLYHNASNLYFGPLAPYTGGNPFTIY